MIQRHYVPRATQMIRCDRCGLLIQFHRDDRGHWIGCPDGGELSEPRPCAYSGCTATAIEDVALWLCTDHRITRTVGRRP
jgi:hypothetical protein